VEELELGSTGVRAHTRARWWQSAFSPGCPQAVFRSLRESFPAPGHIEGTIRASMKSRWVSISKKIIARFSLPLVKLFAVPSS
jgi:hypothetical protein